MGLRSAAVEEVAFVVGTGGATLGTFIVVAAAGDEVVADFAGGAAGRLGAGLGEFLQLFDFAAGEGAPGAGGEAGEADAGDADAAERADAEAEGFADVADLAVLAFGEGEVEDGAVAGFALDADRFDAVVFAKGADAVFFDVIKHMRVDVATDEDAILLDDFKARVSQDLGQFAVVGDEDEAFGVLVEASDGEEVVADGEEIENDVFRLAVFFVGADVAFGLVHGVVDFFDDLEDALAVGDFVGFGVDGDGEIFVDTVVDLDLAVEDDLFGSAAAGDATAGEISSETHEDSLAIFAGAIYSASRVWIGLSRRLPQGAACRSHSTCITPF